MASRNVTGADRYFDGRAVEPGYGEAYEEARRRIEQVDRLVRALDERREELGFSKAELARRAELAPEVVRRLFSVDNPNPTIVTLTALADALDFEFVPRPRRAS
jgi:ribosome-binding protein aMBF1 (putative translation factor)